MVPDGSIERMKLWKEETWVGQEHTVCGVYLCLNMAYSARVPEVLFGPVLAVNIIFTGLRDCCAVVCMYLP